MSEIEMYELHLIWYDGKIKKSASLGVSNSIVRLKDQIDLDISSRFPGMSSWGADKLDYSFSMGAGAYKRNYKWDSDNKDHRKCWAEYIIGPTVVF